MPPWIRQRGRHFDFGVWMHLSSWGKDCLESTGLKVASVIAEMSVPGAWTTIARKPENDYFHCEYDYQYY